MPTFPLAQLHPSPLQPRSGLRDDVLASLAEAFAAAGGSWPATVHPPTVRARPAGGWEILSGHHRTEGARRAGMVNVPADLVEMDDAAAGLFVVQANAQAELTPAEHGRHAIRLKELFGIPFTTYGRAIGRSQTWISGAAGEARVLEAHGERFAGLPSLVLQQAERVSPDKQRACLELFLQHPSACAVSSGVIALVNDGMEPSEALRRCDTIWKRHGAASFRVTGGEARRVVAEECERGDGGDRGRPDLAMLAWRAGSLAEFTENLAALADAALEAGPMPTATGARERHFEKVRARALQLRDEGRGIATVRQVTA